MEPFQRRAVRQKLAELLREPLERIANETRLRKLGRYDSEVARELLRVFGLTLSDEQLRSLERVKDLLAAVENAPRLRESRPVRPERESEPAPPPPEAPEAPDVPDVPPAPPSGTYESGLPYEEQRIGAVAVCCSDGRLAAQLEGFLREGLSLPRCDRLACPGGPAALAGRLMAFWESRGVEDQLRFLVRNHGLRQVVLVAHQGCLYYSGRLGVPARRLEAEQRRDLAQAAAAVKRIGDDLRVLAVFARRVADRIRFEPVDVDS